MGLKEKILITEGRILDTIKPGIKEHSDWLKNTLEVVNEIDELFKKISYRIGGDLPIVKAQFMWDNQIDMYKWYDIEIRVPFHGEDIDQEEIKKILAPVKKHLSDLEFEDKELNAWFVIK